MRRALLTGIVLVLLSEPAAAHAPIKGIGAFYNGMLHPVIVPAHLLLLIGLGLLLGQHAPKISRAGWFAFAFALWAGLAAGAALEAPVALPVLLILTLFAAALVIVDLPVATPLAALLGGASGAAIGLDSVPEAASVRDVWLGLLGTGAGAVLILSYVGGLTATVSRPWQRIAVRVAGSWTAASALIVLSMTVFHA